MIKKRKYIISLVISIFVLFFSNNIYAITVSSDIEAIDNNKYPGIKDLILSLKSSHPSWNFQVEYTEMDFSDVIMQECQGHGKSPANLSPAFSESYSGEWICPICGTRLYDTEKWYCTSELAIKYMMDPRNSINESDVFQFLDLSFDGELTKPSHPYIAIQNNVVNISPAINYSDLKSVYANAEVKTSDGQKVEGGYLVTGYKVVIDNETYTIIKKGDVTKDGVVDVTDAVHIMNYVTGKTQIDSDAKLAGKLSGSGDLVLSDSIDLLSYVTGRQTGALEEMKVGSEYTSNGIEYSVREMAKKMPYLNEDAIKAVLNCATNYKVNPLYLMARLYQEQGATANSPLSNGKGYEGEFVGIYNLFNIRASGNSKDAVYRNGLGYAQKMGWTSPAKAIEGGAEIIATSYINRNQDTLYYQKFNVVGTSQLFVHQYMQNVLAAQHEGETLKKTYKEIDSNLESTYTFTIPLYENMPKEKCARPNTNNQNIYQYVEKTVNGNGVNVRTKPSSSSVIITTLNAGMNIKVIKTTDKIIDGHYWSLIACEETGAYGYIASDYIK